VTAHRSSTQQHGQADHQVMSLVPSFTARCRPDAATRDSVYGIDRNSIGADCFHIPLEVASYRLAPLPSFHERSGRPHVDRPQ
jgi:hypothetical protein